MAYSVLCVLASAAGAQSCTEKQLNKAQMGFRDCMEERKGGMLSLDPEEEPDIHQAICQGLEEMSSGCKSAVDEFAECNGREQVDHLVAIHISAFTEVLSAYHTSVDIRSCPVFHTPPPTIVSQDDDDHLQPEPEYVTAGSLLILPLLPLVLLLQAL